MLFLFRTIYILYYFNQNLFKYKTLKKNNIHQK